MNVQQLSTLWNWYMEMVFLLFQPTDVCQTYDGLVKLVETFDLFPHLIDFL